MKPLTFRDMLKAGRVAKKKGLRSAWDRHIFLDGVSYGAETIIKKNKEVKNGN